jgi:hypothetical protein
MKRFLAHFLLAATIASSFSAQSQTVRPVIVEYRSAARGKFELVNNGVRPLNVVLEPRSFSIDEDGTGEFRPLESDIHLKLSAMSFRIPPQQSHWVFYEATADRLPAWFTIYSSMAAQPNGQGFTIQVELPHTVYLVQKERLEKNDLVIKSARYDAARQRVVIDIDNVSPRLGRALEWQASAKRKKISQNGFPLLPHGRRRLEAEWKWPDPPEKVTVRFEHFTLKQAIRGSQE